VGQDRLGPSFFFIPLVLGPLNSLVWWEVRLGYIALRSFLFLQEQIKDIIFFRWRLCWQQMLAPPHSLQVLLMQLCWKMLVPPQLLHLFLWRL
jgi:hypothetical protein